MKHILCLQDAHDIERLRAFSQQTLPSTFRYFQSRDFTTAISTHVYTLLYRKEGKDVGYAHIDFDERSKKHFLGLCVLPECQGQKIGTILVNTLLALWKKDLYLSVDAENKVARHLYEKVGFFLQSIHNDVCIYKKTQPLMLPVSLGEAIDKLTILDIKLEKIQNTEKRRDCENEYTLLRPTLQEFLDTHTHLYNWLRHINLQIWNLQDTIRDKPPSNETNHVLHVILGLNDMRFRIKKRINCLSNSSLHEQKGYAAQVGLFVGHLGLGDITNMNGAIRYCALDVDYLYVVCKKKYVSNVQTMFGDDPFIEILPCENDDRDVISYLQSPFIKDRKITKQYVSGYWSGKPVDTSNIPNTFYDNLGLDHSIRQQFFHISHTNTLPVPTKPFVFTHFDCSTQSYERPIPYSWDIHTLFTIDPNRNHYSKGHPWYEEAESYVMKPFLEYIPLIKHAKEIHVLDSSFYCLACYVSNKTQRRICYSRDTFEPSREYFFQ